MATAEIFNSRQYPCSPALSRHAVHFSQPSTRPPSLGPHPSRPGNSEARDLFFPLSCTQCAAAQNPSRGGRAEGWESGSVAVSQAASGPGVQQLGGSPLPMLLQLPTSQTSLSGGAGPSRPPSPFVRSQRGQERPQVPRKWTVLLFCERSSPEPRGPEPTRAATNFPFPPSRRVPRPTVNRCPGGWRRSGEP